MKKMAASHLEHYDISIFSQESGLPSSLLAQWGLHSVNDH